jgi:DNA polymerase-3 subunit beta
MSNNIQIKLNTADIKKGITNVCNCINPSTVLPILSNLLVVIENKKISFTGTDLENCITYSVDVLTTKKYTFCINARFFKNFVTRAYYIDPICTLTITETDQLLILQSGDFKLSYRLDLKNPGNFPRLPVMAPDKKDDVIAGLTIPAADFIPYIKNAMPFVSHDDLRPAMTGVYIHDRKGTLIMVATDAHKLYWKGFLKTPSLFKDRKFILPYRGCRLAITSFAKNDMRIWVNNSYVRMSDGEYDIYCRQIDARYPDYEVVLPKDNKLDFYLNRKQLVAFLKIATFYTNTYTKQLTATVTKEKMLIKGGSEFSADLRYDLDEFGFQYSIPVHNPSIDFNEFFFAINAEFMQVITTVCKDEFIKINHSTTHTKAIIIDDCILLMPLMVNN